MFKRGKRSNGQRVWRRERGKREAVVELPLGARTECGWWHSTASGLWMHAGSGATADAPPPLSKAEADKLIRAHLRAMEAAEALEGGRARRGRGGSGRVGAGGEEGRRGDRVAAVVGLGRKGSEW